jgi:hypothetical protein
MSHPTIPILIHVTQAHIDAGQTNDCEACPIALACLAQAALEGQKPFLVHVTLDEGISLFFRGLPFLGYPCGVPDEVYQFISDFDHGVPVSPFTFTLTVYLS